MIYKKNKNRNKKIYFIKDDYIHGAVKYKTSCPNGMVNPYINKIYNVGDYGCEHCKYNKKVNNEDMYVLCKYAEK